MNRDALKLLLQFGVFITFTSLLLLLLVPRDGPAFVVTLMSLCAGGTMLALAA